MMDPLPPGMKALRSDLSISSVQLLVFNDDSLVSTATGFFYDSQQQRFLITNWHVVSGRNFLSKRHLKDRVEPTYMKVMMRIGFEREWLELMWRTMSGKDIEEKITELNALYASGNKPIAPWGYRIDLFGPDRTQPIWREHPQLGSNCDVVAIPIQLDEIAASGANISANRLDQSWIDALPGETIFIVGYPLGLSSSSGLPIWKSGYIASEPGFDIFIGGQMNENFGAIGGTRLPAFFVDTLTREGLSGAPVFQKFPKFHGPNSGQRNILGAGYKFIGVYSGRSLLKQDEAALGICWRASVIEEICTTGNAGAHPHITGPAPLKG